MSAEQVNRGPALRAIAWLRSGGHLRHNKCLFNCNMSVCLLGCVLLSTIKSVYSNGAPSAESLYPARSGHARREGGGVKRSDWLN
ncbi:hypothetical protein CANCADRAFT_135041 [Tortispora caseinolytica NRRL Y-17796]|uniref:Uncharacterized protein n=1 Tax=Tortispora caseinolytica NRRL Y-17796 TaxID=767744 RepID=A0A1E4TBS1_9ASCO|nr:hypothetical protein CANCADRAFT_135041 [Tortispora caseinolytica NRRL Y-17796]